MSHRRQIIRCHTFGEFGAYCTMQNTPTDGQAPLRSAEVPLVDHGSWKEITWAALKAPSCSRPPAAKLQGILNVVHGQVVEEHIAG